MNKMLYMIMSVAVTLFICSSIFYSFQLESSQANIITVKGSDSMVILGQKWAEEYMKKNRDAIQVTGGGSGIGIATLINDQTHLANTSRPINKRELRRISYQGSKLIEIKTAIDALFVYVNINNRVESISFSQLNSIYRRKIVNWKQVGGNNMSITVYGRENTSSTYEFFKDHILNKKDFAQSVQTLPGKAAIVNAVSKDVTGIGYGGKAYAEGAKVLAIKKDDNSNPYRPSDENIHSTKYPLTRYLYIYTTDDNLKKYPEIKKYIKWILSSEGKKIVRRVVYYPLRK